METQTYASAIAANAVLERLLARPVANNLLSTKQPCEIAVGAARQLSAAEEPLFEEAAKAVLALYHPHHP